MHVRSSYNNSITHGITKPPTNCFPGVIHFGIEADNTKDQHVTAETVHSETPLYSQEVNTGTIKKGATKMTMSSTDTQKRKRAQSESAAATLEEAEATSKQWSYQTEQRQSSAFANEGYMRYISFSVSRSIQIKCQASKSKVITTSN